MQYRVISVDRGGEKGFVMDGEPTGTAEVAVVEPGQALDLADATGMEEFQRLRAFLLYLQDRGVRAHMLRLVAQQLYAGATVLPRADDTTAEEIYDSAVRDVDSSADLTLDDLADVVGGLLGAFGVRPAPSPSGERRQRVTFDLRKVAWGAVSLKLLYDIAVQLPVFVLPEHARPSAETIGRCLDVFHVLMAEKLAEEAGTPTDE